MFYDQAGLQRLSDREDDDYRSRFARDRDRILYSTAFRKLAGKTQVVSANEDGLYHTRLTHSLKVAQVGRRVAERLQATFLEQSGAQRAPNHIDDPVPPDGDLIEAACLAHDIGHPPFGHVGEQALSRAADALVLKSAHGIDDPDKALDDPGATLTEEQRRDVERAGGFEGNAQSFRILTFLSVRHSGLWSGLDLTRATLDAATKYPWLRGEGPRDDKWGAYWRDEPAFKAVRRFVPDGQAADTSFEAQLMDWCDDVTYACHDVEDFYRAGMIPMDRLFEFRTAEDPAEVPDALGPFLEYVRNKWREKDHEYDQAYVLATWRKLAQHVMFAAPYSVRREHKSALHATLSRVISYLVNDVTYAGDAPARYDGKLLLHPDPDEARRRRVACDLLQELVWYYVIERPNLATQQRGMRTMVRALLEIYHAEYELLPVNRQEELDYQGDLLRTCVDHVASLTEDEACRLHHRFTGVDFGHIHEPEWAL